MRTDGNGGTRRPQEIQAEIDRTRREMDGTLSAIEQRLTPGQMFDQGLQYLRNSGGSEFIANLGDQAKNNPMPVALVGIGLAWLMASNRGNSGTEPELGDTGTSMRDKAAELRDKATQMRDTAQAQVARAKGSLDTMMREQPLALGAIGLAIGALAAALAPRTEPEERIAGRIKEVANTGADTAQPGSSIPPSGQSRQPAARDEHIIGEPKEREAQSAKRGDGITEERWREDQREEKTKGVKPYAERAQTEPPK
jgi:hypothetical protein